MPDTAQTRARASRSAASATLSTLDRRPRGRVRHHLHALSNLGPIAAVPCHLDYTPRNIIIQPTGDVAAIDFEHARYDLSARDLVRLSTRVWPDSPHLCQALVEGYRSSEPS